MKLRDWIADQGVSDASFAERIGVSRQALSRYKVGDRTPRPVIMARIWEATDGAVAPNDFLQEPEREAS